MKLGICIYSNEPETVWNALRFGNYSIKHLQDEVCVFLLGKGVEAETLDTDNFKVTEQMASLVAGGGTIKACGSCSKLRQLVVGNPRENQQRRVQDAGHFAIVLSRYSAGETAFPNTAEGCQDSRRKTFGN